MDNLKLDYLLNEKIRNKLTKGEKRIEKTNI
jgi:hypothetical protein